VSSDVCDVDVEFMFERRETVKSSAGAGEDERHAAGERDEAAPAADEMSDERAMRVRLRRAQICRLRRCRDA